jgi:DNA-binding IclR family transcriptional regulator
VFHGDRVVAAINIAVPLGRASYDALYHTLGPMVRETSDRISGTISELPSGVPHPAVLVKISRTSR